MPNSLISCANGVLTAAATWALVDAVSLLDSETSTTEVATAPAWGRSASFAPGAVTVDGIAVKLYSRLAAPAGTVSVRLYDVTGAAAVAGTTVTLNVSDLPTCGSGVANNEGGWVLFKWGAGVLLLGAGNLYAVEAQESNAADDVYLWRNATVSNWSRMLRTTTLQAPVAADILHVMGEHTAAGAGTNWTVDMDGLAGAIVDYGSGTDNSTALTVNKRGILNYLFAAATNYYLKLSGNLIIYNGGVFTIGTVGSEIPRDSTAVLEFDPVADGGMGLIVRNGATFTAQGLSRTVGKNIYYCKLNTDEAIGQTELGVDTDTGWLAADVIGIASTTRTYSQCEQRIIAAGGADVNHIDVTVGLTYAHAGHSPVQAEIILLTRNVKIRSASSAIMAYTVYKSTATVNINWVEFYYLGEVAADKRPISIQTTTGSLSIQYSSLHDCEDDGFYVSGLTVDNFTISNNVTWNTPMAYSSAILCISQATSGTAYIISGNIIMYSVNPNVPGFSLFDVGGTITNNTVVGVSNIAYFLNEGATIGTFGGNAAHSNGSYAMTIYFSLLGTIASFTAWRNGVGIYSYSGVFDGLIFTSPVLFGNTNYNLCMDIRVLCNYLLVQNGVFNGETAAGYGTTYGFSCLGSGYFVFENCDFGSAKADGRGTHVAADVSPGPGFVQILLDNTILASTEVGNQSSMGSATFIRSSKHDQQLGNYRTWRKYGTIQTDAVYFHTAAPSERLIPINATNKLEGGSKKREVDSGNTRTFSAWVRKSSVAAGGADYNGAQPRLILKKNVAAGVNADTVLDTMAVGLNIWELLTGVTPAVTDDTVLECIVDCDGTAGFVNDDDWSAV